MEKDSYSNELDQLNKELVSRNASAKGGFVPTAPAPIPVPSLAVPTIKPESGQASSEQVHKPEQAAPTRLSQQQPIQAGSTLPYATQSTQQYAVPQHAQSRPLHPDLGRLLWQDCLENPGLGRLQKSCLGGTATSEERDFLYWHMQRLNDKLYNRDASAIANTAGYHPGSIHNVSFPQNLQQTSSATYPPFPASLVHPSVPNAAPAFYKSDPHQTLQPLQPTHINMNGFKSEQAISVKQEEADFHLGKRRRTVTAVDSGTGMGQMSPPASSPTSAGLVKATAAFIVETPVRSFKQETDRFPSSLQTLPPTPSSILTPSVTVLATPSQKWLRKLVPRSLY